jgi:hypothetical protein
LLFSFSKFLQKLLTVPTIVASCKLLESNDGFLLGDFLEVDFKDFLGNNFLDFIFFSYGATYLSCKFWQRLTVTV